jgi:hypothetical protein
VSLKFPGNGLEIFGNGWEIPGILKIFMESSGKKVMSLKFSERLWENSGDAGRFRESSGEFGRIGENVGVAGNIRKSLGNSGSIYAAGKWGDTGESNRRIMRALTPERKKDCLNRGN